MPYGVMRRRRQERNGEKVRSGDRHEAASTELHRTQRGRVGDVLVNDPIRDTTPNFRIIIRHSIWEPVCPQATAHQALSSLMAAACELTYIIRQ